MKTILLSLSLIIVMVANGQDWKDIVHDRLLAEANAGERKYKLKRVEERSATCRVYYWEAEPQQTIKILHRRKVYDSLLESDVYIERAIETAVYTFGRIERTIIHPSILWKKVSRNTYMPKNRLNKLPAVYQQVAGRTFVDSEGIKFIIPKI